MTTKAQENYQSLLNNLRTIESPNKSKQTLIKSSQDTISLIYQITNDILLGYEANKDSIVETTTKNKKRKKNKDDKTKTKDNDLYFTIVTRILKNIETDSTIYPFALLEVVCESTQSITFTSLDYIDLSVLSEWLLLLYNIVYDVYKKNTHEDMVIVCLHTSKILMQYVGLRLFKSTKYISCVYKLYAFSWSVLQHTFDSNYDEVTELELTLSSNTKSKLYKLCTDIIINSIYLLSPSDLKVTNTYTKAIQQQQRVNATKNIFQEYYKIQSCRVISILSYLSPNKSFKELDIQDEEDFKLKLKEYKTDKQRYNYIVTTLQSFVNVLIALLQDFDFDKLNTSSNKKNEIKYSTIPKKLTFFCLELLFKFGITAGNTTKESLIPSITILKPAIHKLGYKFCKSILSSLPIGYILPNSHIFIKLLGMNISSWIAQNNDIVLYEALDTLKVCITTLRSSCIGMYSKIISTIISYWSELITLHGLDHDVLVKIVQVISTYLNVGNGFIPLKIRGSIDTIILYHINCIKFTSSSYLCEYIQLCCDVVAIPYNDGGISNLIKNVHSFLNVLNNQNLDTNVKNTVNYGITICNSVILPRVVPLSIVPCRNMDIMDDLFQSKRKLDDVRMNDVAATVLPSDKENNTMDGAKDTAQTKKLKTKDEKIMETPSPIDKKNVTSTSKNVTNINSNDMSTNISKTTNIDSSNNATLNVDMEKEVPNENVQKSGTKNIKRIEQVDDTNITTANPKPDDDSVGNRLSLNVNNIKVIDDAKQTKSEDNDVSESNALNEMEVDSDEDDEDLSIPSINVDCDPDE